RAGAAHACALCHEFGRTDGSLQAQAPLLHLRLVNDLRALERVPACVVVKGFFVLPPVFQGLAEREAELITLGQCTRLGFRTPHVADILVAEPKALDVGKRQERATRASRYARYRLKFLDRRAGIAAVPQCMGGREPQGSIVRSICEELPIDGQRLVELAQSVAGRRIEAPPPRVPGLDLQQMARMHERR